MTNANLTPNKTFGITGLPPGAGAEKPDDFNTFVTSLWYGTSDGQFSITTA